MTNALALSHLAPSPDFRYVGLHQGSPGSAGVLAATLGAGALAGAVLAHGLGRGALAAVALTAGVIALGGASPAERCSRLSWRPRRDRAASMAIVPWGILVESVDSARVLRWAAIENVQLHVVFGKSQCTPTAKRSFVSVETGRERFTGHAFGAVSLERLVVHLEAYACEASHRIALDLAGEQPGDGPVEPDVEPLLLAARAYVDSAPASGALDLPPAGYRSTSVHAGSGRTVEVLGEVLRDRTAREVDPRAFAAVVAAELHARELAEDLVALVQSPHPLIAAVAKVAATKLGVARSRVGALDEVAPFLLGRDLEVLRAWAGG